MYWIREEQKNMGDVVVSKGYYKKDLYGFAYEKDGKIKYVDNAVHAYIYEKAEQLEQKGYLITPIINHTYWYERPRCISEIFQDFRDLLMQQYDAMYMEELKKIRHNPMEAGGRKFIVQLEQIKNLYGENAACTALRYAYMWGIVN